MVDKTFKSKINGNLFYVSEKIEKHGREYYILTDLTCGGDIAIDTAFFDLFILQNLEDVSE